MAARIRRKPRAAKSPEQVFGPIPLRQLRDLLGATADRLIPLFAAAATKYRTLERETHADGLKRRAAASSHVVVAKRLQRELGRLLKELDAAIYHVGDASPRGYVHVGGPAGTIGRLAPNVDILQTFDALRKAAADVSEHARDWRERAEADAKLKPGRKVRDRPLLADWIAERLDRAGVRVTRARDGTLAKVLGIVYEAARIDAPEDLYRDVRAAVNHIRRGH